ncbi:MAG: hypothetical protein K6A62_04645 [Bacteroidales bacterium]|nr:hypothetical protein [Bacteroidales bacterium]
MNTMLNDNQYDRLAPYESYFSTVLRTSYPRSPGPRALREIHAVLKEVYPTTPVLNSTCGTCILRVLKKAGQLYFEKKAALELEQAEAVAATLETQEPENEPQQAAQPAPKPAPNKPSTKPAKPAKKAAKSNKPKTAKK